MQNLDWLKLLDIALFFIHIVFCDYCCLEVLLMGGC